MFSWEITQTGCYCTIPILSISVISNVSKKRSLFRLVCNLLISFSLLFLIVYLCKWLVYLTPWSFGDSVCMKDRKQNWNVLNCLSMYMYHCPLLDGIRTAQLWVIGHIPLQITGDSPLAYTIGAFAAGVFFPRVSMKLWVAEVYSDSHKNTLNVNFCQCNLLHLCCSNQY